MKTIFIFLSISVILFSCGKSSNKTDISEPVELKIAAILPVNQSAPLQGQEEKTAMELAVEDINNYFSSNNINKILKLEIKDSELNIFNELAYLNELKEDNIPIVIFSTISENLSILLNDINQAGFIILNATSTSPQIAYDDMIFRLVSDDNHSSVALVNNLEENGIENIIIYYKDDVWGSSYTAKIIDECEEKNITVSDSIFYNPRIYNFTIDSDVLQLNNSVTTALTTVEESKLAVIMISLNEGVEVLKKSADYPVLETVKWYGTDGIVKNAELSNDTIAGAFAKKVGLYSPILAEQDTEEYTNLKTRISGITENDPYSYAIALYDAVWLAGLTLAEAEDLSDTLSLKNILLQKSIEYSNEYSPVSGPIEFNNAGDRTNTSYDFWYVDLVNSQYQWIKSNYNQISGVINYTNVKAPKLDIKPFDPKSYAPHPQLNDFSEKPAARDEFLMRQMFDLLNE